VQITSCNMPAHSLAGNLKQSRKQMSSMYMIWLIPLVLQCGRTSVFLQPSYGTRRFETWHSIWCDYFFICVSASDSLFQDDVDIAAGNVLDIIAVIDPSKILAKIKGHLLVHLRRDILRFGPLVGCSTEVFECFNAIFRFCSILSNHLAPSRDISRQLADQEGLKHRITGGWWCAKDGSWERAGTNVRDFLQSRPILQGLIGWTDPKPLVPGLLFSVLLHSHELMAAKAPSNLNLSKKHRMGNEDVKGRFSA
jgi:hypothetical protein